MTTDDPIKPEHAPPTQPEAPSAPITAEDMFASPPPTLPTLPDKNEPNFALALSSLNVGLRYNLRSQRAELIQSSADAIPSAPVRQWVQLTDRMGDRLRDLFARRFTYQTRNGPAPMRYGKERWGSVINAHLCIEERDPFLGWLHDRPAWDGRPRLDTYLDELFSAGTSPLVRWVGQFLFLGPVHRAHKPGAKLDEMPVLVGPQGLGKSSLLKNLLPPDHWDWFTDGLHLAADPKIRAEALQGRVIVEVSEMAGSNRADLDSLKAFVSRQDDGVLRLSFRHNPEPAPRRCIIVGTSNRLDALPNDPSGNRRFVPIALHPPTGAIEPYFDQHRDQLWAEALVRHAAGVNPKLPEDLKPQAAAAAESHRNRDVVLEDALDTLPDDWEGTLAECAKEIGLVTGDDLSVRLPPREVKRLAAALQVKGYVMRQVKEGGVKKRIWKLDPVPGTA